MKKAVLCLIAVLTTCAPSPVSRIEPEKERTIVVLNLTSLGIPETRTDILSDTLRGEIARLLEKKRTLRYDVLTSAEVEKIVQESDIEKGTVFSDEMLIEFGKILQVDMIGIGFAGYLGSTSSLGVRVVEIETGRIVAAADCQCKGMGDDGLNRLVRKVSADLVGSLSRESSRHGKHAMSEQHRLYSIAVMDMEASGLSETEKKVLSEKLRSSVSHEIDNGKSPYILVERDRMDIVLQTLAGKNEGRSAIDYGKLLQADCILTGSVEKVDGTYTTKVRIVEVESGETMSSAEQGHEGNIDEVLISVIPDMGRELVYGIER